MPNTDVPSTVPRPAIRRHPGVPPHPDAVVLTGVSKNYGRRRGSVVALREVTAAFARGSFTAVMGLTGSGKSTLLQCAAGLERPSSGTVRLGGIDLTTLSRRKLSVLRRRRVGFVFQSLNLIPTLSAAENIGLPLRLDGRSVDQARLRQLAERVGVAGQLRRLPGSLSGGQQQRVAIARALITEPEVIFADEPTAALDPYTSDGVLRLLRDTADELGQTVIVVTHDPLVAARADRVLILDGGRLAAAVEAPGPAQLTAALLHFGSARQ